MMSCVHVVCLFTLNVLFVACVQVLSFFNHVVCLFVYSECVVCCFVYKCLVSLIMLFVRVNPGDQCIIAHVVYRCVILEVV